MHPILLLGINAYLRERNRRGKERMIGKEYIVEIDLASLPIINKVSISVINAIEQKACEVHGNEVKVHSLDAAG